MSTEDTTSARSLNRGDTAVISALASGSSCPYAGLAVLWPLTAMLIPRQKDAPNN